jgi:hypothetical protein
VQLVAFDERLGGLKVEPDQGDPAPLHHAAAFAFSAATLSRMIRINPGSRTRRLPFGDFAVAARFTDVTWTASR